MRFSSMEKAKQDLHSFLEEKAKKEGHADFVLKELSRYQNRWIKPLIKEGVSKESLVSVLKKNIFQIAQVSIPSENLKSLRYFCKLAAQETVHQPAYQGDSTIYAYDYPLHH